MGLTYLYIVRFVVGIVLLFIIAKNRNWFLLERKDLEQKCPKFIRISRTILFGFIFILIVLTTYFDFVEGLLPLLSLKSNKQPSQIQEVSNKKIGEDWQICVVPEYVDINYANIDPLEYFNCPDWMQNIYWDRLFLSDYQNNSRSPFTTAKFYFYNNLERRIQRAYLNLRTGLLAVIEDPLEYTDWEYTGHNRISVIYPNKETKTLLDIDRTPYYTELSDIMFSPNGNYMFFVIKGYDVFVDVRLVELKTGKNILDGIDAFCDIEDIVWSKDGQWFVINNDFSSYGGDGFVGIIAGDLDDDPEAFVLYACVSSSNCSISQLVFDEEDNSFLNFTKKDPSGTRSYIGDLNLKSYYESDRDID